MKGREYYTEFAQKLPKDTVILTAGCAKYRYNKLPLGDINGIPRVLDAGQCNDSYSLAVIALKLKEIFRVKDITYRLQHRLVRTESCHRVVSPALSWSEEHPPRTDLTRISFSERGESTRGKIRYRRDHDCG